MGRCKKSRRADAGEFCGIGISGFSCRCEPESSGRRRHKRGKKSGERGYRRGV
nr:MAG TPA: hypothetical protein [Caudoviricetes sp.]